MSPSTRKEFVNFSLRLWQALSYPIILLRMTNSLWLIGLTLSLISMLGQASINTTQGTTTPKSPTIVAHRGASHDAPENTMSAFRLAWQQGADAIEGDFHLTADGKIVCMHDKDLKRTAAIDRNVADMTLAEIQLAEAGAWKDPKFAGEKIPTLAEVLTLVPEGKLFLIEIKCGPEIMPEFHRVIASSGVPLDRLRVISFNANVITAVKEQMPAMKAYWLTSYKKDEQTGQYSPTHDQVLATLHRTKADGLDTRANPEVLTPAFIEKLRFANLEFHCWTVDDPALARQMTTLGVDSITTNRPAFLRKELAK